MKNTAKRFLSFTLTLCMSLSLVCAANASNTSDTSGGSASSNVTLSSTEDGSLDGTPAATAMSVTVPTVLPCTVGLGKISSGRMSPVRNGPAGAGPSGSGVLPPPPDGGPSSGCAPSSPGSRSMVSLYDCPPSRDTGNLNRMRLTS